MKRQEADRWRRGGFDKARSSRMVRRLAIACMLAASGCQVLSGLAGLEDVGTLAADGGAEPRGTPASPESGANPMLDTDARTDAGAEPGSPDVSVPDGQALLFVSVTGPGIVTAFGKIRCTQAGGSGCTALYPSLEYVVAQAMPEGDASLDWGGACSASLSLACDFNVMPPTTTVTATFR